MNIPVETTMRWRKGALVAVALLLLTGGEARAQDWWWGITYQMSTQASLPVNSDADGNFVEDFSFRGIGFEGRYFPQRGGKLSYGFSGSWNVLNEEVRGETVSLPGVDITAETQQRSVNAFPLLANAHYYLGDRGGIRPYLGLSAGAYYIERRVDVSIVSVDDDSWHFGWAPEAGIVIPLGRPEVAAFGSVKYNWAFSSGGTGDQKYWTFDLGFAYR